ncbi:MAG: phosphotransferase, partial [Mariprofundales bacterium]|nr:phosphotransferase [Mariprofundales bacterium]
MDFFCVCAHPSRMSVYTELTFDEVAATIAGYDLGCLRHYSGIAAGIENSNFFVDTDRGRFVLTIFERMDGNELPWFMRLMRHLHRGGVAAPAVQQRRDGELLFRYHTDGGGVKWGCVVSCLAGEVVTSLSQAQLESA